jgi:hypothetical protein
MYIVGELDRCFVRTVQPYLWRGSRRSCLSLQHVHSYLDLFTGSSSSWTCRSKYTRKIVIVCRDFRTPSKNKSRYTHPTPLWTELTITIVLETASKLISRELEALGIQLRPVYPAQPTDGATRPLLSLPVDHNSQAPVPDLPSEETLIDYGTYGETVLLDHFYLNGQADGSMSYNLLDMPPETYDAFSQVEPLSVIMDPGFNAY